MKSPRREKAKPSPSVARTARVLAWAFGASVLAAQAQTSGAPRASATSTDAPDLRRYVLVRSAEEVARAEASATLVSESDQPASGAVNPDAARSSGLEDVHVPPTRGAIPDQTPPRPFRYARSDQGEGPSRAARRCAAGIVARRFTAAWKRAKSRPSRSYKRSNAGTRSS